MPKISIIMLSYNRAKYIGTAIESVLNQTFSDWELLIIDGGSRDKTEEVVAKYLNNQRIRFIKQTDHAGISHNRNIGLQSARGQFVAVLDSDDVWIDQDKLAKQLQYFQENPRTVLLGTNFERIDGSGRVIKKITCALTDKDIRENFLRRNEFAQSSVLFKTAAALSVGSYDETLPVWEDYDLWLRLGQIGQLANLADFTTAYRVHSGGVARSQKMKGALLVIKITNRYRRTYPHYFKALLKSLFRVIARAIGL